MLNLYFLLKLIRPCSQFFLRDESSSKSNYSSSASNSCKFVLTFLFSSISMGRIYVHLSLYVSIRSLSVSILTRSEILRALIMFLCTTLRLDVFCALCRVQSSLMACVIDVAQRRKLTRIRSVMIVIADAPTKYLWKFGTLNAETTIIWQPKRRIINSLNTQMTFYLCDSNGITCRKQTIMHTELTTKHIV